MKQRALKKLRRAKGETVRQVANALNVTERTYAGWERGDRVPDGVNLVRLAEYFGVEPKTLIAAELVAR